MKMGRWLGFVLLLHAGGVSGLAVYDVNVEATLYPVGGETTFPPVYDAPPGGPRNALSIENRLLWAQPRGTTGTSLDGAGDFAVAGNATEIRPTPGFPLEGPHGEGHVSGDADSPPNSFSTASVWVNDMQVRFNNYGNRDLWMDWVLDVSWDVNLSIDNPATEYAAGGYFLDIVGGGVSHSSTVLWEANLHEIDNSQLVLSFYLPRATSTTIAMNLFVFGFAESEVPLIPILPPPPPQLPQVPPPVPVPEPASVFLLAVGISALAMRHRINAG